MRGELFLKEAARLVDRLARAHLALDSLQHGARWSRGGVRGELGQRRVGRDARAQLQFELVQQRHEIAGREREPREPPVGPGRLHEQRPEVPRAQP